MCWHRSRGRDVCEDLQSGVLVPAWRVKDARMPAGPCWIPSGYVKGQSRLLAARGVRTPAAPALFFGGRRSTQHLAACVLMCVCVPLCACRTATMSCGRRCAGIRRSSSTALHLLPRTARHPSGQQSQHSKCTNTARCASITLLHALQFAQQFFSCLACGVPCCAVPAVALPCSLPVNGAKVRLMGCVTLLFST